MYRYITYVLAYLIVLASTYLLYASIFYRPSALGILISLACMVIPIWAVYEVQKEEEVQ